MLGQSHTRLGVGAVELCAADACILQGSEDCFRRSRIGSGWLDYAWTLEGEQVLVEKLFVPQHKVIRVGVGEGGDSHLVRQAGRQAGRQSNCALVCCLNNSHTCSRGADTACACGCMSLLSFSRAIYGRWFEWWGDYLKWQAFLTYTSL